MELNPDNLFLVLAFVLPGYVLQSTIAAFVPRGRRDGFTAVLQYFQLSLFNFVLCSPVVYVLLSTDIFVNRPIMSALAWLVVFLGAPLVIGGTLGAIHQKSLPRKILGVIGFKLVSPIPTSWDYFFSTSPPVWVLATLKDGGQVGGLWGPKSFASAAPSQRDLYLERVYQVDPNGPWKEVKRSHGILLSGDEIRHLEFIAFQEDGR